MLVLFICREDTSSLAAAAARPAPPHLCGDTRNACTLFRDFPEAGESHVASRQECLRNAVTRSPIGDLRLDGSAVMQTSSGE